METGPARAMDEVAVHALSVRAAAGESEAVERLLAYYHERLLGRAARKIGVDWQGKLEPDDIVQETYVEVFAGLKGFSVQGPESFYRWVGQILDHTFIDAVRRLRRKKRDASREVSAPAGMSRHQSFIANNFRDLATPSIAARKGEAAAFMMCCIAQLPDDQRLVVERVYLNQEHPAEVAKVMGRTEDAVRRLGSRAIEKLREAMGRASRFLSSG